MAQDLDFDEEDLRAPAGPRSFERGRGYLAAVTAMEIGDGWITATGCCAPTPGSDSRPGTAARSWSVPCSTTATSTPLGGPRPKRAATTGWGYPLRGRLALADRARTVRPADALGVYLRLAEPLMKQTGNAVYEQLTGLLLGMRDCHRRLGSGDEFAAYLAALRAGLKRRRNLMRLLDQHGL